MGMAMVTRRHFMQTITGGTFALSNPGIDFPGGSKSAKTNLFSLMFYLLVKCHNPQTGH